MKIRDWLPWNRKTIDQWATVYGFKVLDPDGFDRKDSDLMTRKFTKTEWDKGWPHCTIMFPRRWLEARNHEQL